MLAAAVLAGACNKVPLTAPTGTVITLISETNSVPANGSSDIIAVLIENGTTSTGTGTGNTTTAVAGAGTAVHNGTLVTFTTSLGRVDPQEARTTNGRATVKLIADGRSGVATITAFSGGASKILTVNVGSAAAVRIIVTADPQALPSTGGTTTISARIEDQGGNGLAAVPMSFSTTAGTLNQGTVLTDDSGYARALLTSTAAATVTVTAGGGTTGTLTGTVGITVRARPGLTVTVPAGSIAGAPTQITVAVTGTTLVSDVTLDFGDGSKPRPLGPLAGSTVVSHTYGAQGTYSVTATATEADGTKTFASTDISVNSVSGNLVGSPNPSTANTPVTFTFTATPSGALIDHVDWDFGDGAVVTGQGTQIAHVYDTKGTYTIIAHVFTPGGGSFSKITQQQVN